MEPSVLDKKTLNNYIVSMRNNVTRSKVHTINRMARQAKQLRLKNGTEEQKDKNKKKADRLIQEIMVIKELDKDDVSKFGLTTTQDLKRLQANMKSPLKIRAIARLCLHKFVATKIKEFKEKYLITPGQVLKILRTKKKKLKNLKPTVNETISDVEMKEEKEKISRVPDENGIIHDSGNETEESINFRRSESESEEENIHSEEEESVHSEEENDQHSEEDENVLSEEEENVQSEEEQMDNDSDESKERIEEKATVSDKSCVKSVDKEKDRISITKSERVSVKLVKPIKDCSFSERKILLKNNIVLENSDDSEEDEEETEESTDVKNQSIKSKTKVKEKKGTEEMKVIDPFFMTKENEHYRTSQVPMISNNTENEFSNNYLFNHKERQLGSDFETKRFNSFQSGTTHNLERWGTKDNSGKSLADEKHMQKYGFFSQANEYRDGFKNRRERRLNLHTNIDKPQQNEKVQSRFDYERRERKPNIDVQKSIKMFDAKNNNRDVQPFPRRVDAKPNNRDVQIPRRFEAKPEVEKLHPSWEAKKKLTSIAQFQGKKITFDD